MKILIATLAAAAAVTAAVPAAAQPYDYGRDRYERPWNGGQTINERQRELHRLIAQGERRGSLTPSEARHLRREFYELARLEDRYRVRGVTYRERVQLERRFDRLESQIVRNMRDGQYGYGYGDRDRYGRWR